MASVESFLSGPKFKPRLRWQSTVTLAYSFGKVAHMYIQSGKSSRFAPRCGVARGGSSGGSKARCNPIVLLGTVWSTLLEC